MTTSVKTRKTCFKCKVEKVITEFYVHPAMGDGRLNKCKECARKDQQKHYLDNIERYVAYERERAQRPERKKAAASYLRKRPQEKRAANIAVGNAVRDGLLIPMPCEKCGEVRAEAHHDDYSKPLDVRWLCRRHHLEHHGKVSRVA